jgi:hypothetical protein
MPVLIQPSPKIRKARPRQPETPAATQPRFVVQPRVESARRRSGGATRILKAAFVLGVLGLGIHALWSQLQGPDPHYLKAQQLVTDYEFGKPRESRNYDHANYREALAELALVDPDSRSADPAEALRIELERNIAEFRERQERLDRQLLAARAKSQRRRDLEQQARLRNLMAPQIEFPECQLEEGAIDHEKHDH